MHQEVRDYVNKIKGMYPEKFKNCSVLDVWSLDINWNNKEFFENANYLWLDIIDWENVDILCNIIDYNPWKQFDITISTEMLEHNRDWRESLLKMYRLTKRFWLMIITCAWPNRWEHWTINNSPESSPATNDYYHNISKEDVLWVLPNAIVEERRGKQDLCFYLLKI